MRKIWIAALGALLFSGSAGAWEQVRSQDPMSGKESISYTAVSTNEEQFSFPYGGGTSAVVTVRKHPRYGRDVIVRITKGQILCRRDDCPVLVRFDDRPPMKFSGVEASDNDPSVVFIEGFRRFASELKRAKRMRVSFPVYHQGIPVFEFDVSGFDDAAFR